MTPPAHTDKSAPGHAIRVAAIDKNPLVLHGLRSLLENMKRFELVVSANDGERFLDMLGAIKVDLVVSSWIMPYCSGREMLMRMQDMEDAPRVVVYTGATGGNVIREAMRFGAAGFCAKVEPPEKLLAVMEGVAAGQMIFPFIDVRELTSDPLDVLTPRERELLAKLAGGFTNIEIAGALGVSTNTVKFHLRNLYEKLDVRNRAEAAALFVSNRDPLQPV